MVPLLAVAHQASLQNLIQEVEINYLNSKSADKDFIAVEGSMTSTVPAPTAQTPRRGAPTPERTFLITRQIESTTDFELPESGKLQLKTVFMRN
jgi:hypothetical protein